MVPKIAKKVVQPTPTLSFDGRTVKVNDSVFVSAPWGAREGEPYMIARVMEFLPSTSIPSTNPHVNSEGSTTGPRARVAYYLRPRDISNRYISDFRLIVATMHADIIPLTYIRGVCTVKHRDEIKDLDNYRREKDTFYFNSLYDRYLHRYFDAVPTNKIRNAPVDVVNYLVENFEYILCEPAISNELSDAQRGCTTCSKWAASAESVTCALCKGVFHLSCLDPPLLQRPKTGYSWSCAPCSKAHEDEVEAYMETGIAPVKKIADSTVSSYRSKGKGRSSEVKGGKLDKGKEKEEVARLPGAELRTTNGWTMRYFGMHTDALAVLDPHDSLYPRASTRLGNKFQVVVPVWDNNKKEQDLPEQSKPLFNPKRSRNGTPTPKVEQEKDIVDKKKKTQLPGRGEDEAAQVIYQPSDKISDPQLDKLLKDIKALPVYTAAGVDLIDKTLSLIKDGNIAEALLAAAKVSQTDLGHAIWTGEERKKLVEGAAHHNNDIEEIADEIETKTIADIVKRYYMILGHGMQEDVPANPEGGEERVVIISRSGRRASGVNYAEDWFENDESSEDEGSVVGPALTVTEKRGRICAVCSTKSSAEWYHCPESFGETAKAGKDHLMCEECGVRWRHYGASYPPTVEELKPNRSHRKVEKVEGEIKKEPEKKEEKKEVSKDKDKDYKGKEKPTSAITATSKTISNQSKAPSSFKPCVLCKRMDPKPQLSQCGNCGLSVHSPCYGIPDGAPADWLCDLCDLEKKKTPLCANLSCILCPMPVEGKVNESDQLTALDCLKPTEGKNYVHLLCGIFHPEVRFSEPSTLTVAEGVSSIPLKRRTQTCHICKKKDLGACVKCEDCLKHFHVACAWTANYKFAFEIHPLKKKRAKDLVIVKFKEEDGSMLPSIWCPDHHFSQLDRVTYDLGQRDPRTKLTALQTYVRGDKVGRPTDSFQLLRQSKRLEPLVVPILDPPAPIPSLDDISEGGSMEVSVSPPPVRRPSPKIAKVSVPRAPAAPKASKSTSGNTRKNPNPKGSKRPPRPPKAEPVPFGAPLPPKSPPITFSPLPPVRTSVPVPVSVPAPFPAPVAKKIVRPTAPPPAPSRTVPLSNGSSGLSALLNPTPPLVRTGPVWSTAATGNSLYRGVTLDSLASRPSNSRPSSSLPRPSSTLPRPSPPRSYAPQFNARTIHQTELSHPSARPPRAAGIVRDLVPGQHSPFSGLPLPLPRSNTLPLHPSISTLPRYQAPLPSSSSLLPQLAPPVRSRPEGLPPVRVRPVTTLPSSYALPLPPPPPLSIEKLPPGVKTNHWNSSDYVISAPLNSYISSSSSSNASLPINNNRSTPSINGIGNGHPYHNDVKRKVDQPPYFGDSLDDTSPKRMRMSTSSFVPPHLSPPVSNGLSSHSNSNSNSNGRPATSGKALPVVDFALDPSLQFL